jgi:hypothetical protein
MVRGIPDAHRWADCDVGCRLAIAQGQSRYRDRSGPRGHSRPIVIMNKIGRELRHFMAVGKRVPGSGDPARQR